MTANQPYKTGKALEMAVKAAAAKSEQDTNRAVDDFYVGRLLERVFSQEEPRFVLKGGRSILARTINARYTRDTDFLYKGDSLDEAADELIRLASLDLRDHIEFRFKSKEPIAQNQEYRDGYHVIFEILVDGTRNKGEATVDLVVDQISLDDVEQITPANRLVINRLPVFDYHIYPATCAIADKVCATMQLYSGRESSRVRDLVDLIVYLTTERFEGKPLSRRLYHEAGMRHLSPFASFKVPSAWYSNPYSASYAKQARNAKLSEEYHRVRAAETLVKKCIDPAIEKAVDSYWWNPVELRWEN